MLREPLDEAKKYMYSIAIETVRSIEIFRHYMNHEESAKLHMHLRAKSELGTIGRFAVVKDEHASPLSDENMLSLANEEFIKSLACVLG